jgi:SET domain-containing protein 6
VGRVLTQLLQLREGNYATTLEEDEAILRGEQLPHRETMAIRVRLGEKQVLRKAIQEAATFTASDKRMRVQDGSTENLATGTKRKGYETNAGGKRVKK